MARSVQHTDVTWENLLTPCERLEVGPDQPTINPSEVTMVGVFVV